MYQLHKTPRPSAHRTRRATGASGSTVRDARSARACAGAEMGLEFQHLRGGTAARDGAGLPLPSHPSRFESHGHGNPGHPDSNQRGPTLPLTTRQEFWSKPRRRMMPNPPVRSTPAQLCDHVSLQWMAPVISTSHSCSSANAARHRDLGLECYSSWSPHARTGPSPQDSPGAWGTVPVQFPALLSIPVQSNNLHSGTGRVK